MSEEEDLASQEENPDTQDGDEEIDHIIPNSSSSAEMIAPMPPSFLTGKNRFAHTQHREWAHMVDIQQQMPGFDQLVPDPAYRVGLTSLSLAIFLA